MRKQNNALYFKNSFPSLFKNLRDKTIVSHKLLAYKTSARFRACPKKDHFPKFNFPLKDLSFMKLDFELFQACNDFSERFQSHPRKRSTVDQSFKKKSNCNEDKLSFLKLIDFSVFEV